MRQFFNSFINLLRQENENMRNILEDIKNNSYKKVYLLYGEENYLKKQYKEKITKAICGDDTMNYSYFDGKNSNIKEIIATAETLPFFAEKRLIVMENTGFLKNSNDELAEYIKIIPETTTMVFVEAETDKRNKVYKAIKENGYICEMQRQNIQSLEKWIAGILTSNNKKITEATLVTFIEKVGQDMDNISNELEKLICYMGEREIVGIEDVEAVCTEQITSKIFDMIDALGNKNRTRALDIYYDLIANKEAPLMILYMISRQFNIMLQVMELKAKGLDGKTIAQKMGLAPFIVTKTMRQVSNFKYNSVKEALYEAVELEEKIKLGNINEKIAVELLLIKYSA